MTRRRERAPIAPTVIGQGGRIPPNRVIDNDSTGDVDTNPMFDPKQDGIDFHESLEGMLLQFNDAVATGPSNSFGEVSIVGDNGRNAGLRTAAAAWIVAPGDFNPERFILDDVHRRHADQRQRRRPLLDADRRGGRLLVRQLQVLPVDRARPRPAPCSERSPNRRSRNELAIATFNVENLAPADPPASTPGSPTR